MVLWNLLSHTFSSLGGIMRTSTLYGVALAALTISMPAFAQSSDTASETTDGTTTIAAPITLTENSALQFGVVVKPTSGSNTVTVDTSTCTPALGGGGNAALLAGTSGCATYSTGGESGLAFDISTDSTFDMTRSGGSETITVTLSQSASSGTIGQSSADFKVGGSFSVGTGTVAGSYSGSFTTTVTYQ